MAAEASTEYFSQVLLLLGGKVWLISDACGLSVGFWLALQHFELNLTSEDAPIYHFLRRGEAKAVLGHSFSRRSRKTNFLSPAIDGRQRNMAFVTVVEHYSSGITAHTRGGQFQKWEFAKLAKGWKPLRKETVIIWDWLWLGRPRMLQISSSSHGN
jgi:hypothetical protein